MKITEYFWEMINYVSLFYLLGAIPIAIISYFLGFHLFTYVLVGLYLPNFFLFLALGSECLSDEYYFKLMNRTPEELKRDEFRGQVGLICTALFFISIFVVTL